MLRRLAVLLKSASHSDWLIGVGLALDPCPRSTIPGILGRSDSDALRMDTQRLSNDSHAWMSVADRHWPTPNTGKRHGRRSEGTGRVDGLAAE